MTWRLFTADWADYKAGTLVDYPSTMWAGFPPEAIEASLPVPEIAGNRLQLPDEIMDSFAGDRGGASAALDPQSSLAEKPPRRKPGRPRRRST